MSLSRSSGQLKLRERDQATTFEPYHGLIFGDVWMDVIGRNQRVFFSWKALIRQSCWKNSLPRGRAETKNFIVLIQRPLVLAVRSSHILTSAVVVRWPMYPRPSKRFSNVLSAVTRAWIDRRECKSWSSLPPYQISRWIACSDRDSCWSISLLSGPLHPKQESRDNCGPVNKTTLLRDPRSVDSLTSFLHAYCLGSAAFSVRTDA